MVPRMLGVSDVRPCDKDSDFVNTVHEQAQRQNDTFATVIIILVHTKDFCAILCSALGHRR